MKCLIIISFTDSEHLKNYKIRLAGEQSPAWYKEKDMNNIRRTTIKAIIDELTEKFETMKSEAIEKLENVMSEE